MFRPNAKTTTAIAGLASTFLIAACTQFSPSVTAPPQESFALGETEPTAIASVSDGQGGTLNVSENLEIQLSFSDKKHPITNGYNNTDFVNILTSGGTSENTDIETLTVDQFKFTETNTSTVSDEIGSGTRTVIVGQSDHNLSKTMSLTKYDGLDGAIILTTSYKNTGDEPIFVSGWTTSSFSISTKNENTAETPAYWSFQGASFSDRRDWVQPVKPGYSQDNFMGMNASDYGSGTPFADIWTKDYGVAVAHLETTPKLVSFPISADEDSANLGMSFEHMQELAPGESTETFDTLIALHKGDFFAPMDVYRQIMAAKGLEAPTPPDSAYEAIWCAWGYDRDYTNEEVIATLGTAKSLGLTWAVLDDGWQTNEGDWTLDPAKYPNGDADMKAFVKEITDAGLKPKLWIAPLAMDPGSDMMHEDTDMLLLNEWGEPQLVTWWNSFYICPAYDKSIENARSLVRKIMQDWGYQGLKIDGQHLNGVAPCHNPAHNHDHPEESMEKLQDFWKAIYDEALAINPEAVVEICPCGTSYAFHNMPYMNQSVSSDPLNSWQVRLKGKTIKALMGANAAYYGDHVELSDNKEDWASSLGIGAVVGTKFTSADSDHAEFALTKEREAEWKKWISAYNEQMLPKGQYRGDLYDIAFDLPETHAVEKDGQLHYGFYAENWNGEVELRGLTAGRWEIWDYVNDKKLGEVDAASPNISVEFTKSLLVEARPVTTN